MFFHVILTVECNLQCRYCFGETLDDVDADFPDFDVDYSLPKKMSCDVGLLDTFCRRDPDCVLIFYGGEPLLCVGEIKRIMDHAKAKHFIIQTNGLLLDSLALVRVEDKSLQSFLPNSGRIHELLTPGVEVILRKVLSEKRKTAYDLIGVYYNGQKFLWIPVCRTGWF